MNDWFKPESGIRRRGRKVRASGTRQRVFEDTMKRTWDPLSKTTEDQMNAVLDILMAASGPMRQADIAEELGVRLELNAGSSGAATSASLLWFRREGWVRYLGDDERSALWEIVG